MQQEPMKKNGLSKRTWVALIFIVIVIPAVLISCNSIMQTTKLEFNLFGQNVQWRLHYAISLMVFEKRKPLARELIFIATLSAIAVAGRAAFFMLPNFKPVCAIVIIAGVCFGAESGFLVGAVSGFVSNFFFGQGSHTPWQMFCFGIIGFIAGILFKKGLLKKTRLPLCIFGGLSVFFIYGGISNIGTMMGTGLTLNAASILARLISAIPMDLIHAGSTVFFLLILSQPMIEKLERIKTKYGLIEP